MSKRFLGFILSATFITNILCLLVLPYMPTLGFGLLVIIIYGNIHFLSHYKKILKLTNENITVSISKHFFWHIFLPLFIIYYYNIFEYSLTFKMFFIVLFIMILYCILLPIKKIYQITKTELFINIFSLWILIFIIFN